MAMFRHVRWLHNLIRVANAATVFDGFFLGPSTRAVSPSAEWLGGFLVTCSWRGTSEHTVKQACLSSCCIVRGGPSFKDFSDRFPERMVLDVKPGRVGSPTKPLGL